MEELLWSLRMARVYCAQLEAKIQELEKDKERMAQELTALTTKESA
jgi:hypothetical protein